MNWKLKYDGLKELNKTMSNEHGPWAAAAFAGMSAIYGLLGGFLGKDSLRVQIEESQRAREGRRRQIDHLVLMSRGYAEVIRTSQDAEERKSAQTQITMLRFCIEEHERDVIEIDAFIEKNRPVLEQREKAKEERDTKRVKTAMEREKRIQDLEAQVAALTEANTMLVLERDALKKGAEIKTDP